jgi:hypothetical protein
MGLYHINLFLKSLLDIYICYKILIGYCLTKISEICMISFVITHVIEAGICLIPNVFEKWGPLRNDV